MPDFSFELLDVFTSARYRGNGLAVVRDAIGLTTGQMQSIAREFNQSETVFILPPDNKAHSARVRLFTPASEVPFAGHPTVGTAAMLAGDRFGDVVREEDAIIVLEEGVGPVRVGVRLQPDAAPFAEIDLPKMPVEDEDAPSIEDVSLVLGLTNAEISFENHRPSRFDAGLPFVFIPVRNLETLKRISVDAPTLKRMLGGDAMIYAYCRETLKSGHSFHARMFAPLHGVPEDPATGSAAAALAGAIMKFDQPAGGTKNYIIEQGHQIGRDSEIHLELLVNGGLDGVRIGGHVVKVAEGTISV